MTNFNRIFGETKPVIAMVHLLALPGTPLYDEEGGVGLTFLDVGQKHRRVLRDGLDGEVQFLIDPEDRKSVV